MPRSPPQRAALRFPALTVTVTLAAFALSFALTLGVKKWACAVGLVDRPDGVRRLHRAPVPRVGGIAVYVSVLAVVAAVLVVNPTGLLEPTGSLRPVLVLGIGAAAVFTLGLVDDLRGFSARTKFLVEAAIALGVFAAGVRIESVGLPGGVFFFPTWMSLVLTLLWLVGITNAFNLIDGSDGVASGAAIFASGTMAVASLSTGQEVGVVLALALVGATLGFLLFNFPPASIFLGDCGSLFLGFTLAGLGLVTVQKPPTVLAVAIPVVSCGLPILDTGLVMMRRFLRGQPMFNPDRGHIHHRLRELGHSPRRIALLLYAACGAFSVLSLLLVRPAESYATLVIAVAGAIMWLIVRRLDIPELRELKRIFQRALKQRRVIAHNIRIRGAAHRLREARNAADVLDAMALAFEGGEFQRVELWLESELGRAIGEHPGVRRLGMGYLWSFTTNGCEGVDESWSIQLPFRDGGGTASPGASHISLWQPTSQPYLLTDLNLIAGEFQPELRRALVRIRATRLVREHSRVGSNA